MHASSTQVRSQSEPNPNLNAAVLIATEAKSAGNALFEANSFPGAIVEYTKGINELLSVLQHPIGNLLSVLYTNRAACFMGLSTPQLDRALEDCKAGHIADPEYVKPLYRQSLIYEKLAGQKLAAHADGFMDDYNEALTALKYILRIDAKNRTALAGASRIREIMQTQEKVMGTPFPYLDSLAAGKSSNILLDLRKAVGLFLKTKLYRGQCVEQRLPNLLFRLLNDETKHEDEKFMVGVASGLTSVMRVIREDGLRLYPLSFFHRLNGAAAGHVPRARAVQREARRAGGLHPSLR